MNSSNLEEIRPFKIDKNGNGRSLRLTAQFNPVNRVIAEIVEKYDGAFWAVPQDGLQGTKSILVFYAENGVDLMTNADICGETVSVPAARVILGEWDGAAAQFDPPDVDELRSMWAGSVPDGYYRFVNWVPDDKLSGPWINQLLSFGIVTSDRRFVLMPRCLLPFDAAAKDHHELLETHLKETKNA